MTNDEMKIEIKYDFGDKEAEVHLTRRNGREAVKRIAKDEIGEYIDKTISLENISRVYTDMLTDKESNW